MLLLRLAPGGEKPVFLRRDLLPGHAETYGKQHRVHNGANGDHERQKGQPSRAGLADFIQPVVHQQILAKRQKSELRPFSWAESSFKFV